MKRILQLASSVVRTSTSQALAKSIATGSLIGVAGFGLLAPNLSATPTDPGSSVPGLWEASGECAPEQAGYTTGDPSGSGGLGPVLESLPQLYAGQFDGGGLGGFSTECTMCEKACLAAYQKTPDSSQGILGIAGAALVGTDYLLKRCSPKK